MCLGHKVNKEKIGNILILLSSKIQPLYHTKLLKLLFLIDERSINEIGIPVTWLDYKAWKLGPVSPEIYDLKFLNCPYEKYIDIIKEELGTRIVPAIDFDDSTMSDFEMKIINEIILQFQSTSAAELVDLTHEPGGLWDKTIKKFDIVFDDMTGISPYDIDMTEKIKDDSSKLFHYNEVKSMLEFEASLID